MKRNIVILYAIAFFQGMVFYGPIATLYRQAQGISVLQITWIESISLALCIALEIPWGILADKIGYRKTMIICSSLYFVSKIIFWQAAALAFFLLERILLSIVIAGISGVDSSILYLSCSKEQSTRVFGIYQGLGMAGLFAAGILFSLFIKDDYRLAAFLTMISYGIAMILSFFIIEVKSEKITERSSVYKEIKQVFQARRWLLFLFAVAFLSEMHQTITVFLSQVQYRHLGMDDAAMGIVYILSTFAGLCSVASMWVVQKLGSKDAVLVICLIAAISCGWLSAASQAASAIGAVMVIRIVHSIFQPIQLDIQNQMITTQDRATRLSVHAMLIDAVAVGTNLIFGALSEISIMISIGFGVLLSLMSFLLFLYYFHNVRSEERIQK